VEVVVHGDGGRLVHLARTLEHHRLVPGAVPRVVVPVTVADHHLGAGSELWELPAGAARGKHRH